MRLLYTRSWFRFVTLALLFFALPVLAQVAASPPVADAVTTPTGGTTPLGFLLMGLVTLGGLALTAAFAAAGLYFSRKASDGAAWSLANRLWVAMQQAVTHAEAEIRPQLQKALADGKLSAEEKAELKSRALAIFKGIAGDLLGQIPKVLGFKPEGVPAFLSGLLERAVAVMKVSPAITTQINKAGPAKVPTPTPAEAAEAVKLARLDPGAEVVGSEPPSP